MTNPAELTTADLAACKTAVDNLAAEDVLPQHKRIIAIMITDLKLKLEQCGDTPDRLSPTLEADLKIHSNLCLQSGMLQYRLDVLEQMLPAFDTINPFDLLGH
jgi:hypothetical protein